MLFVALLFLLFPDGHLPSRRWLPVLWVGVAAASLFVVVMAISTPPWQIHPSDEDDPFSPTTTRILVVLICTLLLCSWLPRRP